jgi:hypothetical protein
MEMTIASIYPAHRLKILTWSILCPQQRSTSSSSAAVRMARAWRSTSAAAG